LTHLCVNSIIQAHEDRVLHLGDITRAVEALTIRPDDSVTEVLMPVTAASEYIGKLSPPQVALFGYWAAHTKMPAAFNWKVWRRAFTRKWNCMTPGALINCIETIALTADILAISPSLKTTVEDALVARQDTFDESHITRVFDGCSDIITRRSAMALCCALCKLMPEVTMVSIQWESAVIPSKPQCFAAVCKKFGISGGEIEQSLTLAPSMASSSTPSTLLNSSKKRYRAGSDVYRGGASMTSSSDGALEAVWEWMTGSGEWIPFHRADNTIIEAAFTDQKKVKIASDRVVDFTSLQQHNTSTGRVRPVRRVLRQHDSYGPRTPDSDSSCRKKPTEDGIIGEGFEFDGSRIYLNKLGQSETNEANELSFADIIGDKSTINAVFLSSFGSDIEWLLEHFAFATPIILIDDYDRKRGATAEIQQPFGE
ncbi:hypothetical protein FOZ63_007105, partial [Perkinsus olseni]